MKNTRKSVETRQDRRVSYFAAVASRKEQEERIRTKELEKRERKQRERNNKEIYQKLINHSMQDLKGIAMQFNVRSTGTREEIVDRIMNASPPSPGYCSWDEELK
jgi:hypothetical protein